MRKADKWGIPDVDALLDSIDGDAWSEWMEFEKRHANEDRHLNAALMALIANCHKRENAPDFTPADFLGLPKPEQSPAEMRARLRMMPVDPRPN